MSRLYGKGQRTFQERFGTQKLADRIEDIAVRMSLMMNLLRLLRAGIFLFKYN